MRRIANIHTHMSDMYSQPKNPELVPQIYSLPEISAHSEIPNKQTSTYSRTNLPKFSGK